MEILNRKAKFNYFIEEELECGIELLGNEVKSIREGSCNIKDSYAVIKKDEVFVINMFAEFRPCQKFIFDLAVGKKMRYHRVGLVGEHFFGKFDHLLLCLHFPEIFV